MKEWAEKHITTAILIIDTTHMDKKVEKSYGRGKRDNWETQRLKLHF